MKKNRIFYAVFYLFVLIFFFFFEDYISLVLLSVATAVPLITVFITVYTSKRIQLKISTDKLLAKRGDTVKFLISAVNYSKLPVPFVKVDFYCRSFYEADEKNEQLMLSIPASDVAQTTIAVKCERCCIAELRTFKFTVTDYFGLYSVTRKAELAVETTVLPKCVPLNVPMDFKEIYSAESEIFSKKKPGDDCSEVFQIREYRDGDNIRQIHHKLSNKLDRLMVKEFSMPVRSAVSVIAEFSIDENDEDAQGVDTMLDILYSLSDRLKESNMSFTLWWYDSVEERLANSMITDDYDMFLFIRTLLRRRPSVGLARTIREYNLTRTPEPSEHIFYVTPMLDINEIGIIINAPQPDKVTVLYTGDEETDMPGIAHITPDTVSDVCTYLA
ncbi:MAG: DUF58 domain-containing protein [Clostridia bacterium]|nr:DUF58 domain-containing protein [Clostridia bacterium]